MEHARPVDHRQRVGADADRRDDRAAAVHVGQTDGDRLRGRNDGSPVRAGHRLSGSILSSSEDEAATSEGSSAIASILLVVVAVLLLVTALRQLLAGDDPDAAPPKWLEATASMAPGKAFLLGAGLLAIGAKFWVFTLGAIAAIDEADLSRSASILAFVVFAVLAVSVQLVLIGVTVFAPARSDALLDRASGWLSRHNRVMVIMVGLVFGVWFLVKGLDGLGLW